MHDTPLHIEQRLSRMMAQKSPSQRLQMAGSMFDAGRELIAAGLRRQYGNLSHAQLRGHIFLRIYQADFQPAEIEKIMKRIPDMELMVDYPVGQ